MECFDFTWQKCTKTAKTALVCGEWKPASKSAVHDTFLQFLDTQTHLFAQNWGEMMGFILRLASWQNVFILVVVFSLGL